jgi:cytochrome c-type biogenesis protein
LYDILNSFSQLLYGPLTGLVNGFEHIPIIAAFFLGVLAAASPCQLTGNIAAITLYGNRSVQERIPWFDVILYLLGKITVFTGFGLLIWYFGKDISRELTIYFPWVQKLMGPIYILIGLHLIGIIQFKWSLLRKRDNNVINNGKIGSYVFGVVYSLGFCPTMFVFRYVDANCFKFSLWNGSSKFIWCWNSIPIPNFFVFYLVFRN